MSNSTTKQSPAAAVATWRPAALDLANWTLERLVNRTDVWGAYLPLASRMDGKKSYTAPANAARRVENALTLARIAGHYSGVAAHDVIGLHAIGTDGTCKWVGWDIDRHSDAVDPDTNRCLAVELYDRLVSLGFSPLLNESDDRGGFHLRAIFAVPIASADAHAFGRWLVRDMSDIEVFPKQSQLTEAVKYGNWLRLPGRHHTRDVWARVYDGFGWREGADAVNTILPLKGDDAALIPAEAAPATVVEPATPAEPSQTGNGVSVHFAKQRCRAYIAKLPDSVSGDRGHDKVFQAACETRRFGLDDADAMELLRDYNATASPPWSEADLSRKLAEASKTVNGDFGCRLRESPRRPPGVPNVGAQGGVANGNSDIGRHTDLENARQLVAAFGGRARWHHERGRWIVYDRNRGVWAEDVGGWVERQAKALADREWAIVSGAVDRKAAVRHATRASSAAGIAAMIALSRSEEGITVTSAQLDADPWLLNVLNGVVQLRTGDLLAHDPSLLLTRQAPVAYDRFATCDRFDQFLAQIMPASDELVGYLQRLVGVMLSGDVSEQIFPLWVGQGANGKSVLVDTLLGMLGTYAGLAPPTLLTTRAGGDEHPTELADLDGTRAVFGSETEEDARLRIQLVKRLTGDAAIKARFMRQDYFTFHRRFKLVLVTNNKPVVSEAGNAVWRRLRLVPFNVVIPPEDQDAGLLEKLRSEWPGILAWAVRGCLEWQRNGMQTPAEVLDATADYAAEQDVLGDYLAARVTLGPGHRVIRNDMLNDYLSWASQTGEKNPLGKNPFFDRIRKLKGVAEAQWRPLGLTVPVRGFQGIKIGGP